MFDEQLEEKKDLILSETTDLYLLLVELIEKDERFFKGIILLLNLFQAIVTKAQRLTPNELLAYVSFLNNGKKSNESELVLVGKAKKKLNRKINHKKNNY